MKIFFFFFVELACQTAGSVEVRTTSDCQIRAMGLDDVTRHLPRTSCDRVFQPQNRKRSSHVASAQTGADALSIPTITAVFVRKLK